MQGKLVVYKFLPPKINIFAPNFSNTLSFYLWSVDDALSWRRHSLVILVRLVPLERIFSFQGLAISLAISWLSLSGSQFFSHVFFQAARTDAIDSRRSHYDAPTYQDWFLILIFLSFTTIQFRYQTRQNSPCPAASKIIFTNIYHAIPFYYYFDVCLVGEFQTGQFCSGSSWSQVTLAMLSSVSFRSSYRLKSQSLYFVLLDCGTQSSGRVSSLRIGLALLKFFNEYFTL
jgi:hypothetical protein